MLAEEWHLLYLEDAETQQAAEPQWLISTLLLRPSWIQETTDCWDISHFKPLFYANERYFTPKWSKDQFRSHVICSLKQRYSVVKQKKGSLLTMTLLRSSWHVAQAWQYSTPEWQQTGVRWGLVFTKDGSTENYFQLIDEFLVFVDIGTSTSCRYHLMLASPPQHSHFYRDTAYERPTLCWPTMAPLVSVSLGGGKVAVGTSMVLSPPTSFGFWKHSKKRLFLCTYRIIVLIRLLRQQFAFIAIYNDVVALKWYYSDTSLKGTLNFTL